MSSNSQSFQNLLAMLFNMGGPQPVAPRFLGGTQTPAQVQQGVAQPVRQSWPTRMPPAAVNSGPPNMVSSGPGPVPQAPPVRPVYGPAFGPDPSFYDRHDNAPGGPGGTPELRNIFARYFANRQAQPINPAAMAGQARY